MDQVVQPLLPLRSGKGSFDHALPELLVLKERHTAWFILSFGSDSSQQHFILQCYTFHQAAGNSNRIPPGMLDRKRHCCKDRRKKMKAHILVVDDDTRITDLLRRILAYEGYSVTLAASGTEALDRSLERRHDLVVLDIMLPGLDG